MRKHVSVESPRDRVALAEDAGFGRASFVSVIAGTLVAYGAFLVLLAIAGGIAAAAGVNTDLGSRDFHSLGIGGGIAVAVVLFLSYLFGGYVAGRMARRAGVLNGILVFVLGLVMAAAVAGAVAGLNGTDNVVRGIRSVGLPTSADQWREIGTVAGIASLAGMLLGSLFGGRLGERWHSKLLMRALDPAIGPEGRMRRDADGAADRADERHTAATDRVRAARAERRGEVVRGDGDMVAARRAGDNGRVHDRDRDGVDDRDETTRTDDERYDEAQRAEADRIAAESADRRDSDERTDSRGRHFLRRG